LIFTYWKIFVFIVGLLATVIVPALNEEEFIGNCLRSLRAQTVPAYIMVLDNGSTDKTVEIAKEYADEVLVLPGLSLRDIKQVGIEKARTSIVVTTDADTFAPPEWLEKLLRHFSDPTVVAVGGPVRPLEPNTVSSLYTNTLSNIAQAGLLYDANMAFRRDIMLGSGGYAHLKRGWDWELSSRLSNYGRVVYDPEAYVVTDVPFNRQLEFAALAANAGLLGIGASIRSPGSLGFGSGYYIAFLGSAIDQVPDNLHHSQVALAGLTVLSVFRGSMPPDTFRFLAGLLTGCLGHHFITEDIFSPTWVRINGSLFAGLTLLLASS
jgi:glycosyltransferase involved in cell wall biosynthesis